MNKFWQHISERNRFQKISCISCKQSGRLGKWRRRSQEPENTIEEWLRHNNAITKGQERPAYMTVDLYLTQHMQEERSLKRAAPDDATTTASKRKK